MRSPRHVRGRRAEQRAPRSAPTAAATLASAPKRPSTSTGAALRAATSVAHGARVQQRLPQRVQPRDGLVRGRAPQRRRRRRKPQARVRHRLGLRRRHAHAPQRVTQLVQLPLLALLLLLLQQDVRANAVLGGVAVPQRVDVVRVARRAARQLGRRAVAPARAAAPAAHQTAEAESARRQAVEPGGGRVGGRAGGDDLVLAVRPLTHLDGIREVLAEKRTERGFARAPAGLTPTRALRRVLRVHHLQRPRQRAAVELEVLLGELRDAERPPAEQKLPDLSLDEPKGIGGVRRPRVGNRGDGRGRERRRRSRLRGAQEVVAVGAHRSRRSHRRRSRRRRRRLFSELPSGDPAGGGSRWPRRARVTRRDG